MPVTLGGVPLQRSPDVGWKLTYGVKPYERVFRVSAAGAEILAKFVDPVSLVIDLPGRPRREWRKLYIVSIEPTNSASFRYVRVRDGRWLWGRARVVRHYNMPIGGADYRRLQQEGVPVQVQQVSQDLVYAKWSLYPRERPKTPWTPKQVIQDVLETVAGAGNYQIRGLARATAVLNTKFDDPGDEAVELALRLAPGAQVTLDENGKAIVTDELDGGEADLLKRGPVFVGPTLTQRVDLRRSRPVYVEVLFDRRLELRFDSEKENFATTDENARTLENVGPVPDVSLNIAGDIKATGTWERLEDMFPSWPKPVAARPISHDAIQSRWLNPTFIEEYTRPRGSKVADPAWTNRIACILRHYRQTYRICRSWRDRIKRIFNYRVGIVDQKRGTRARAQVFSDYAVIPTMLGLMHAASEGDTAAMWNVYGYDSALVSAKASAPAILDIEDDDQQIVRVNYKLDLEGRLAQIVPSGVVGADGTVATLASYDLRKAQKGQGEGLITAYGKMKSDHRLAIVLTVEPGAPNDERVCHREIVTPGQAEQALGLKVGACNGAVWTIRVQSHLVTADWEWQDGYANSGAIDEAFGLVPKQGAKQASFKLGNPINYGVVRAVAVAAAAALYAGFLDGPQGQHVIRWDPTLQPTGRAASVEHVVPAKGNPRTIITFPMQVHGIDLLSLMPEGVRNQLLRPPE